MERVSLATLIHETVSVLTPQAKLHKIKLREDYENIPLSIVGNGNLLQQVVMNLILNAFQATSPGGLVSVTTRGEGAEAVISVQDTGCGIPLSHIAKVFDPFFTTQPVGKGTGLGLSICYTIVKQHGGVIAVESVEQAGSTFTIRLPRADDAV